MKEIRKIRSMLYLVAKILGWITACTSLVKLGSRIFNVIVGKFQTRSRGYVNGQIFGN